MGGRAAALIASAAVCATLAVAPANAAFPGTNGRIAYSDGDNIWSVNADGSDPRQVTSNPHPPGTFPYTDPEWSPDGTRIAYNEWFDVAVINADGSNRRNITAAHQAGGPGPFSYFYSRPSWSPDGSRIALSRYLADSGRPFEDPTLWTIKPDGTDLVQLATSTASSRLPRWHPAGEKIGFLGCGSPCGTEEVRTINVDGTGEAPLPVQGLDDWSPDGAQVAFGASGMGSDVFTQRIDGSGLDNVTENPAGDDQPNWSPDGLEIVFSSDRGDQPGRRHLWIMNADGSGAAQLTPGLASGADWQAVSYYPRPLSAPRVRVSLVPAYRACASPNRTHGPPLGQPSCAPPVLASSEPTFGMLGAGRLGPKGAGKVVIAALAGSPSSTPDDADVRLRATVTDVRQVSDLSDYTGELEVRVSLRITDRLSTPHLGGAGPATLEDFVYSYSLPCTATPADATTGSRCEVDTSADAIAPGMVTERGRAIWALGPVSVRDESGEVFLRQGIFVP